MPVGVCRSGVEPPTGTIHPRESRGNRGQSFRRWNGNSTPHRRMPVGLCRSGVEPPTGTIHPRESRETEDRVSGAGTKLQPHRRMPVGVCRSGVEPPTGTIHPRESRGTEDRVSGAGTEIQPPTGACRSAYAGRGLNPRPERSTHAKAGEQRTEFPALERSFNPPPAHAGRCMPVGG